MKLLNVDTLSQAEDKLIQAWEEIGLRTEMVILSEASERILAEDITADSDVPDFRKSTVDGYAVRAKDTQGAGESIPCFLDVRGEVSIGTEAEMTVGPGQCVYVPTGGMIPEGADAMVMVEHAESFSKDKIAVYSAVSPGRGVIQAGEDIRKGRTVLNRGTVLTPARIGVLASLGYYEIPVFVLPSVTIISTGNELVKPGDPRETAQIYDINTYGLEALCRSKGFNVIHTETLADEEAVLRKAISDAMISSDIVAVSGGSSQGKQDFTEKIFNECSGGGVFTHGLALKPGKPTIFGIDKSSRTLLVGLPGHPVAALMVFDLLIAGTLRKIMGVPEPGKTRARMEVNVAGGAGRAVCQTVEILPQDDDLCIARPVLGKSGLISVLARADGYVMIDADTEGIKKGEVVEVIPL